MNRNSLCLVVVMAFLFTACTKQAGVPPADIVFTNGQIKTVEGWAEALAVSGADIVATGDAATIAAYVGANSKVIDLDGRTVLPGFHDLHVHPIFAGMVISDANHTNCRIAQGSTLEELRAKLGECVDRVSEGEWVTGGQWDASTLGTAPHKSILDEIAPDTPVLINDTSGHSAWANSRALEVAEVTAETPNPPGGILERDSDGEPTGIVREAGIGILRSHVPRPSDSMVRKALEWALNEMLANGITTYTEASNGFVGGAIRELEVYGKLADEGILKHRVRICLNLGADAWMPEDIDTEALIASRAQYERPGVRLDCIKIFLDGVPTDSHTAAMLEPYADTVEGRDDESSRYGMLLVEQQVSNDAVIRFDNEGLAVKFHAAGDAAVRSAIDAIAAAREANGMSEIRHDPGHATFVAVEDLKRAKDINATIEFSPYIFSPSPIMEDITKAIGPERMQRAYPFRDAIDSGALVVAGSDWAVVPSVNPWIAVETMVTRRPPGGGDSALAEGQAISVAEAIDIFTINAALHMGHSESIGTIAVGKLADIIVLDRNPYEVPATELHKTSVLMTMINGELVYEAELVNETTE